MVPPPPVYRPPQPLQQQTDDAKSYSRKKSPPPPSAHTTTTATEESSSSSSSSPRRPVKHWPTPPPLPPATTHWPASAVQQPRKQPQHKQHQHQYVQHHHHHHEATESERKWQKAPRASPGGLSPNEIDQLLSGGGGGGGGGGKPTATTTTTPPSTTTRSSRNHSSSAAASAGHHHQGSSSARSVREAPPRRKQVGWNENVFVVGGGGDSTKSMEGEGDGSATEDRQRRSHRRRGSGGSRPVAAAGSSSSSIRPGPRHDEDAGEEPQMPSHRGKTSAMRPPTPLARKHTLIENKQTRDTRWTWSRMRVAQTLQPYRQMLSEQDDLLPDRDEFRALEDEAATMDEEFAQVRDSMLEDNQLSEKEVAAFFEGFALFNVKLRSLQTQLEAAKQAASAVVDGTTLRKIQSMRATTTTTTTAITAGRSQSMVQSSSALARSKSGVRSSLMMASKGGSGSSSPADSEPRMFGSSGKSLRALSIRKVKEEHGNNEEVQRLLKELQDADKKQKKLEKQLQQAGIVIAEDIPYDEAKNQVEKIAKRMQEIGSSEVTHEDKEVQAKLREEYFKLEQDMEKYNTALMLTDEYIEEQEELERKWEEDNARDNMEALKKLRRHMPVEVRSMSEAQLSTDPSPNGKVLSKAMARKFKRTNVLQLLRIDPDEIVRMHPSTLENLRVTGLTLTERRALYAHLETVGPRWKSMQAEKMTERKWTWWKMMKQNFKENLGMYQHHVEQYGPPENHPYATREDPSAGCPLIGKQCPLKADKTLDYDGDYGYPDEAVYEVSNVQKADAEDPGAKAKREALELARDKRTHERSDALKKHYKGRVLQVSLANGSCGAMDEVIDRIEAWQTKWIEDRLRVGEYNLTEESKRKEISNFSDALNEMKLAVLPFAERSGMQLTGKKDVNADQPDNRSPVELGLCEEVFEAADDFFDGITARLAQMKSKDSRLKSTIEQLRELLIELHERNLATLKELGCDRPAPSRKRKSRDEIRKEVQAKLQPEESRDVGIWQGWPLACSFYHAVAGHKKEAYHMLECCVEFFDAYAKTVVDDCGKDQDYVLRTFRSSLGWISYFALFAYYLLGMWNDCLPTEGLSEDEKARAKGSMGYTGVRLAEIGFHNEQSDLSLDGLRALFKEIVTNDIEELLEFAAVSRARALPRHASVLRASGRRVSDASAMEEAAELIRRVSIIAGSNIPATLEEA